MSNKRICDIEISLIIKYNDSIEQHGESLEWIASKQEKPRKKVAGWSIITAQPNEL